MLMTPERMAVDAVHAADLDDLLSRWHAWQQSYTPARAFRSRALVCGDYHAGRHWDEDNGVSDAEAERRTMRAVDDAVSRLDSQHRMVIQIEARNLSVGSAVFRSPRLPVGRDECAKLLRDARAALIRLLLRSGVL